MDSFDRHQVIEYVYRIIDGELKLIRQPFTEDWSPERRREKAAEILSGDYVTFCAFDDGRVVGQIMLKPWLDKERMIVESLHVSGECRHRGIGRRLIDTAKAYAGEKGAKALYISACSSQETIAFYLAMGCRVSDDPIPEIAAAEPCDIQLECEI